MSMRKTTYLMRFCIVAMMALASKPLFACTVGKSAITVPEEFKNRTLVVTGRYVSYSDPPIGYVDRKSWWRGFFPREVREKTGHFIISNVHKGVAGSMINTFPSSYSTFAGADCRGSALPDRFTKMTLCLSRNEYGHWSGGQCYESDWLGKTKPVDQMKTNELKDYFALRARFDAGLESLPVKEIARLAAGLEAWGDKMAALVCHTAILKKQPGNDPAIERIMSLLFELNYPEQVIKVMEKQEKQGKLSPERQRQIREARLKMGKLAN
jgi:hypothetical protein